MRCGVAGRTAGRWNLLAPALLGLTLTSCTSPPTGTATPTPTPEVTSAAPTATPSATPTATPTPSPPATSEPANEVTIDITIADGQVSPNGKKMAIRVGQQIVLNVTSDKMTRSTPTPPATATSWR